MIKPRETIHFDTQNQIKEDWMIGLINLEIYNSFLNITEENNKFERCSGSPDDAFSFLQLKDKLAKTVGLSYISLEALQHNIHLPEIIEAYRELMVEESQTDGFHSISMGYT